MDSRVSELFGSGSGQKSGCQGVGCNVSSGNGFGMSSKKCLKNAKKAKSRSSRNSKPSNNPPYLPPANLPPEYIHHRLIHLTPADYDDFVNIIRSARGAFCLTPVGMMQFNDVLQNLKRGKQTKELWQRISLEMATFSP